MVGMPFDISGTAQEYDTTTQEPRCAAVCSVVLQPEGWDEEDARRGGWQDRAYGVTIYTSEIGGHDHVGTSPT